MLSSNLGKQKYDKDEITPVKGAASRPSRATCTTIRATSSFDRCLLTGPGADRTRYTYI